MLMGTVRRGALLVVASLVSGLALSPAGAGVQRPQPRDGLPRLMLWAWERPTDLRSLDAGTGVAFLAQTLILRGGLVQTVPRRNPLLVPDHTALVAVTRIESAHSGAAAPATVAAIAAAVAGTMSLPQVRGVQIDFDAAESERPFYRALLQEVRHALGRGVPLSITALASWCAQDRWMSGLPVDEAVPMLFRMGPVHAPYVGLARSTAAAAIECRGALGTSLDEPLHVRAAGRRVYVFNASAWTDASLTEAREMLE
jgi:hypothetical protein